MSEPTFVPLDTGDTKDDDGQVLDSLYQSVTEGPTPIPDVVFEPHVERPTPPNRLMPGTLTVNPAWDPTTLFPADTRRIHFHMKVNGTANVDFIQLADETGKLMTATGSGRIYAGQTLTLDDYTGAVCVSANGSPGSPTITWWCVTK